MAKVSQWPVKFESPKQKREQKHDWEKLLDGQVWEVTQGVDFTCKPTSFRTLAYEVGRRRGLTVRMKTINATTMIMVAEKIDSY